MGLGVRLLFGLCMMFGMGGQAYLPGLAPVSFCEPAKVGNGCKSDVELFVNRLDSIESVLSYEYSMFDFCQAPKNRSRPSENLGQVLFGERIEHSPYKIEFKKDVKCAKVCDVKVYDPTSKEDQARLHFIMQAMQLNYHNYWIIDNMPVTWCYNVEDGKKYCSTGFPVGCFVNDEGLMKDACAINPGYNIHDTYYLFNHVDITITYHSGAGAGWQGARLVAAKLEPRSIKHTKDSPDECKGKAPLAIPSKLSAPLHVLYSYSITFIKNDTISWASRWDYILESMPHSNIQWFSIINSLIIVLFLSGMVAMILLRTLHKDIARYNQDDAQEEFGWKLVHGDVFRPPRRGMLLAVCVGSGTQTAIMVLITLFFACLGFLSPANRGALMTCAVVIWVLLGTPAGFVSAHLYKTFGGGRWKLNILLTALLCPGVVFADFFLMNVMLRVEGSSAAVPFSTLLAVLALWFCVSLPLTFLGAYVGFKRKPMEQPVRTNQLPRQIPPQTVYTHTLLAVVIGGILPFACIFIQLFFILNSIWSHQLYYMFGFLFLVFIILLITCSEATILLCYFQLCSEDYHWWWRSFLTSGFTAMYLLIYAMHYFATHLHLAGLASIFLYFGYTLIMAIIFFLLTGTVGFLACLWFVRTIYSVVKVD
uniref:transmembrane 9 superfamily member 2-like isoform X1 n=1 Tax=Myxine glutinosa TaxID=7769 RepID=UPI00358FFFF5